MAHEARFAERAKTPAILPWSYRLNFFFAALLVRCSWTRQSAMRVSRCMTSMNSYDGITGPRRTPRGISNVPRRLTIIGARFVSPLACPRCGLHERVVVRNKAGSLQSVCLTCKRENERESKRRSRAAANCH